MRMAIGGGSVRRITTAVCGHLKEKGSEPVPCGALAGGEAGCVDAARSHGVACSWSPGWGRRPPTAMPCRA